MSRIFYSKIEKFLLTSYCDKLKTKIVNTIFVFNLSQSEVNKHFSILLIVYVVYQIYSTIYIIKYY